jgi:hypothetical protein
MDDGLNIREDGDDFILVVTDASDKTTEVRLTSDQMLTLCRSAQPFQDYILKRRSPTTEGVVAVLLHPAVQVELNDDLLTQEIHLTLIDQNGGRQGHSLPVQLAEDLVASLPDRIAYLKNKKSTMQ